MPNVDDVLELPPGGERTRMVRKIQMYWAILRKAGYNADEAALRELNLFAPNGPRHFDPGFSGAFLDLVYGDKPRPSRGPGSLDDLVAQLERVERYRQANREDLPDNVQGLFDPDDQALLEFLQPSSGGGPRILRDFMRYHDPQAGNFVAEILRHLEQGDTVILDLGNAPDELRTYFSDLLSRAVFSEQEERFTSDSLGNHFVQLYFEEAHNLFPKESRDFTGVYTRFAKEGAKFHIGMVYSTQSPSTINSELLAQTENFFVAHISSQTEVESLAKLQIQFSGLGGDILRTRTPGFMRMMTFSHRFIVPLQVNRFEAGEFAQLQEGVE